MAVPAPIGSVPVSSARAGEPRVVLRTSSDIRARASADGVWWPRTRSLVDELPEFFEAWPSSWGRIHRILYSPPDWDDHPHSVAVSGRRVKTGCFPRDDTHQLTVTLADRSDRLIAVIAPQTPPAAAARIMRAVTQADRSGPGEHAEWDNEGGHL